MRLLWDTLTPNVDQWPPLYILWRIHSETHTHTGAQEGEARSFVTTVLFSPHQAASP